MKVLSLIIPLIALAVLRTSAQQYTPPTQYMNLPVFSNPAAATLSAEGAAMASGRWQWAGIEGAPTSFRAGAHLPIGKADLQGGLLLRQDKMAVEKQTDVTAFVALPVQVASETYLSLSIQAGFQEFRGDYSSLDAMDPAFAYNEKRSSALIGAGLMLYKPGRFMVGLSMPAMPVFDGNSLRTPAYYHLLAAGLLPLEGDFQLKPAMQLSYSKTVLFKADFSGSLIYAEQFGAGINGNNYGEFAGLLNFYQGRIGIGYSYQFATGHKVARAFTASSTHELSFRIAFGKEKPGFL
ncbi:MAG: PorP/SprF family type IX secretion system membrane protein [Candidatus Pseudobacter hemicellulosilyticus]|uniref:PorP/SprF family type IX secretion system membrane protein n=1 Tax=Candidatus Pseudobacter hemicellulosilyticus TaxID=3121375 RepID=A0AAJ5WV81_9BACT|nr:MAG: PorP/SprF family type IX secretion system membrane protein [Pseudobacter sp.]